MVLYTSNMSGIEIITYTIVFLAVFVQVFFLVTFFEKSKTLRKHHNQRALLPEELPSVTIIVPCWNEEATVHGTITSLLALNYPKEKVKITIVDDGSTDATWSHISQYKDHPQISIYQKENGGKHTAVNFGIGHATTDLIACLDADSFVHPQALANMVEIFSCKPDVMAVAPTLIIENPKNMLQSAQRVEYHMSTYNKKMLAFMDAIHVTPGPFSVFRKEVFQKIGMFRKAHNTEDQEIAYRMQENHMRIEHCHNAYVYTTPPDTIRKLFKQRLRWIYGFIQNTIDYRRLIFNPKYGHFSLFTLPSGVISIIAVIFLSGSVLYNIGVYTFEKIIQIRVAGFSSLFQYSMNFDLFFIPTETIIFTSLILYGMVIFSIVVGTRLSRQGSGFDWYIIPYLLLYSIIAPLWLLKAVWNSIGKARQPAWR